MSRFVISLDFELFWGVSDSRNIAGYGNNIQGERAAVPRILALFRRYDISSTWATVGMLMCRDYEHWRSISPTTFPGYLNKRASNYSLGEVVRESPQLFFARSLVEEILVTPGQELGTHTYSHFYCGEAGASPVQFAADLRCANLIAAELGVRFRSLVFPRNQVREEFLPALIDAGIEVYRGNADHWVYRHGHLAPIGLAGRAFRVADSCMPLTGPNTVYARTVNGLTNLPASLFLRPWSRRFRSLNEFRIRRIKSSMTAAALAGGICHIWWHPHNFGVDLEQNLAALETLLQHFVVLKDKYGMTSTAMGDARK